jgi:hypothetical protein
MPVARFEMPDGRIARFEVPEGTSPEDAQAQIEAMMKEREPAPAAPPPAVPPAGEAVYPRGGNDALKVFGEFAQSINVSVPQLLDMPSHVVNWMLEKAGADVRIPATMERNFNRLPGGEGGFMEPGMARDAVRTGGQLTAAAAGMMPVQRAAGTAGALLGDILGVGSTAAKQTVAPLVHAGRDAVENLPAVLPGERAARQAAELPLLRQSGDVEAAGYKLKPAGTGVRVVPDKVQQEAIKQGLEPRMVALVKSATSLGRQKMGQMLDNVDAQRSNLLNANQRPGNVAGDSILARVKIIQRANKAAGQRIRPAVEKLNGVYIDTSPATNEFWQSLGDMGITFDSAAGKLNFDGSMIDQLPGPINAVQRLFTKMVKASEKQGATTPGMVNARAAHDLKRYIDEVVTYGKGAEGLSGETVNIMKTLRHNLNGILREASPEYAKANTQYSETIDALDSLQDIAGKRMDLMGENADRALGVLSRRIFSNAVSGVPLDDAITQIDQVAKKYVSPGGSDLIPYKLIGKSAGVTPDMLDDSLREQIQFASQMERYFKIAPTNSFQGGIEKAGEVLINSATGGTKGVLLDAATSLLDKVRGVNEENAMKAFRELLKD